MDLITKEEHLRLLTQPAENAAPSDTDSVDVIKLTKELGQPRLFRRDLIQAISHYRHANFGEVFREDPSYPSNPLVIDDVFGLTSCVWDPSNHSVRASVDLEKYYQKMCFKWFGCQDHMSPTESEMLQNLNRDTKRPIRVSVMPTYRPIHPTVGPEGAPLMSGNLFSCWALVSAIWQDSEPAKELSRLVSQKAPQLTRIESIVCFSLGSVWNLTFSSEGYATMIRYLSVRTVADILNSTQRHKDGNPKIRILAQDSDYIEPDRQILGKQDIAIVSDPDGYLEIDEHTLVIDNTFPSIGSQPSLEIIADVTCPNRRPAAILAPDVRRRFQVGDRTRAIITPMVFELLESYEKVGFENVRIGRGFRHLTKPYGLWLWDMHFYFKLGKETKK